MKHVLAVVLAGDKGSGLKRYWQTVASKGVLRFKERGCQFVWISIKPRQNGM
jgi:hypothetical protein